MRSYSKNTLTSTEKFVFNKFLPLFNKIMSLSLVECLKKNSKLEVSNKFERIYKVINDPMGILEAYLESNPSLTISQREEIKSITEEKEISSVSKDVISHSLSYLSFKEITKLKRISKNFNVICSNTKLSSVSFSSIHSLHKIR